MLQIRDLNYSIADRELLKGVNWTINPGRRTALIGPNGAGKTTLLKILNGELEHQSGFIQKPKDYKIGYLPQEELALGKGPILEIVLQGRKDLVDLEYKIYKTRQQIETEPQNQQLLSQLGELEHQFESLDGYRLESKAKAILSGLGFLEKDFFRSLTEFSGGWRMRAYLAKLLLQAPNLLLLDEPTNHLDLPSLEWLEQYLLTFSGSIVAVSHDRYFVDRLCQDICELDRGRLEYYAGNYHFYENLKEEKRELLLKRYEEQKSEIDKQEKFINRFRYKNTKAVQVQSRIKQLERMEKIELPSAPPPRLDFNLRVDAQSYRDVLHINKMSFRYEIEDVLQDIDLSIYRGEKIALVGINGAGKTTLTRLIHTELLPQKGSVEIGQRVSIGYYAQHQIDALNFESTVYDEVSSTVAMGLIPKVRNTLGIFQLRGDDVFKKIGVLSGGEKARVSLSKILLSPVNFLIMDEPTNHLDMASKEALEQALIGYDGTLLLISHDRYFLDKLVSRVIEIKDHHVKVYEGNYSDYLAKRQIEKTDAELPDDKKLPNQTSKKSRDNKRAEAEARQAISKDRKKLTSKIEKTEKAIEELETRKVEIEKLMENPETYRDGDLAAQLQKDYSLVKEKLEIHYAQWEDNHSLLEELLGQIE
jgi:ATP-binding cassette, subfamily F, member 3